MDLSTSDANKLSMFGTVLFPDEAEEPILAPAVRAAMLEWLQETWAADELKEVGLTPRRRAMFKGAPGTGKTTLAHHMAARLGLPMLKVRAEKVQSQYIGESAIKVGKLFDTVEAVGSPMVLFFDEFDSLGSKRMGGGRNEVGEQDHNHMVNVLLANFDRYAGFVIAATNYGDRIDEAIWRRFEIHIEIELPGAKERRHILERYLKPFMLPEEHLMALSEALATASPALIRQMAEHIKRQIVVGPKAGWPMDRNTVIARMVTSVAPHPDLGKPRLWSQGPADVAIRHLPWPLQRSLSDYPQVEQSDAVTSVVPLRRGRWGEE